MQEVSLSKIHLSPWTHRRKFDLRRVVARTIHTSPLFMQCIHPLSYSAQISTFIKYFYSNSTGSSYPLPSASLPPCLRTPLIRIPALLKPAQIRRDDTTAQLMSGPMLRYESKRPKPASHVQECDNPLHLEQRRPYQWKSLVMPSQYFQCRPMRVL